MLYLLDANVLIDANHNYYPMARVPEFWEWLLHMGVEGHVKMPIEIHAEVARGKGELAKTVRIKNFKNALVLNEEPEMRLVDQAVRQGYAHDLADDEIQALGRDPFLIAYALRNPSRRRIVTTEVSKPTKQRANRHLPDAAKALGIRTCNTFEFVRQLDFRTNWRTKLDRTAATRPGIASPLERVVRVWALDKEEAIRLATLIDRDAAAASNLATATDLLVRYLKHDKIAAVVRRPVPTTDGTTLLDLLLRGSFKRVLKVCQDMCRFNNVCT